MACYEKDKHLLNFDVNIARQALSTDVGEQDELVKEMLVGIMGLSVYGAKVEYIKDNFTLIRK